MPTPHGSRGGMAFSADELRVLRRALAIALQSIRSPAARPGGPEAGERAEAVRECLRLAEAVDEAVREADRLRAFLLADLARYRAALPGSASGYLARLEEALALGCPPRTGDLAALRELCAEPTGPAETERRAGLLRRCERPAGRTARGRGRLTAVPRPEPGAWAGDRTAAGGAAPAAAPGAHPAEPFPPHRRPSPAARRVLPA
ncbi:MAG TPA: hypothetical protein VFY14_20090 [Streptomyces sp.]|nr:hypothetical protein [Streptomyces sp.]